MGSFRSGQVDVTAAGTAEQIVTTETLVRSVIIKALAGNTGNVFIGNDGAGDVTSGNGYELQPGEVVILTAPVLGKGDNRFDLSTLWVDAAVSGDDVCALWFTTG